MSGLQQEADVDLSSGAQAGMEGHLWMRGLCWAASRGGWAQRLAAWSRWVDTGRVQQRLHPGQWQPAAASDTNTAVPLSQGVQLVDTRQDRPPCSPFYNIPFRCFSPLLPDLPAAVTGSRVIFSLLFFLVVTS